jgi:hypothetical protein
VRCFHSYGEPDQNAPASVKAAWSGGMGHVDVYMFPCTKCGNPASQAQSAVSFLRNSGTRFGMMWLDIEGPGVYWGSDHATNQQFFADLVSGVRDQGVSVGIYSSQYAWNAVRFFVFLSFLSSFYSSFSNDLTQCSCDVLCWFS